MSHTKLWLGMRGIDGFNKNGTQITMGISIVRRATRVGCVISANLQMTMKNYAHQIFERNYHWSSLTSDKLGGSKRWQA